MNESDKKYPMGHKTTWHSQALEICATPETEVIPNPCGNPWARIRSLLVGLTFLGFMGCTVGRQVPFNPDEFSGMLRKGSGIVTGRVSVDTQHQGTIHPHFQQIILVPVNAYSAENVR